MTGQSAGGPLPGVPGLDPPYECVPTRVIVGWVERSEAHRSTSRTQTVTRSFLASGGDEAPVSESRSRRRGRGVWQSRYWEHTCRDEADLKRCVDYIHWNPVKHSQVQRVKDYPWSTFHRFVKEGEYDPNWGASDPCPDAIGPGWE